MQTFILLIQIQNEKYTCIILNDLQTKIKSEKSKPPVTATNINNPLPVLMFLYTSKQSFDRYIGITLSFIFLVSPTPKPMNQYWWTGTLTSNCTWIPLLVCKISYVLYHSTVVKKLMKQGAQWCRVLLGLPCIICFAYINDIFVVFFLRWDSGESC